MPCCLCESHTDIKNCNHNKPIQILYLLSNAGRETTERGARDDRIWGERRPNLGRGTTASGTAFAIKSGIWIFCLAPNVFYRAGIIPHQDERWGWIRLLVESSKDKLASRHSTLFNNTHAGNRSISAISICCRHTPIGA